MIKNCNFLQVSCLKLWKLLKILIEFNALNSKLEFIKCKVHASFCNDDVNFESVD